MSKPIRKLAAEQAWREQLPVHDAATAWLDAARAQAHARFAELGLPTPRTENWRWSDIHRYLDAVYTPQVGAPQLDEHAPTALLESHLLKVADASLMVFVNGRFAPQYSRIMDEEGVEILALSEAPLAIDWADLDAEADDAMDLLNLAHAADGALVRVRAGVDASIPLLLLNIASGDGHSTALRHFIRVEEEAAFTLFEAQLGGGDHFASQLTRAVVHDNARLARVQVNERDMRAIAFTALQAHLGAHASLHDTALLTGGRYTRQHTRVRFAGEHGEAVTNAAYLLRGRQHADTRLRVDHLKPHCTSRETFRCVMDDHARGAFQGLIHVAPGAAQTDGEMSAHGLLLGEAAEFDSKPELEIYHDDVVCAHGSAVGALDEQQLFYLRARGVPERKARAMLVAAFAAEVFDQVADDAVREALATFAEHWLAEGVAGNSAEAA